jgi:DNA-binding response OmpR family regulator
MNNIALVVDDDADLRALLSFKLLHSGFEVHGESDGENGLAAIELLHPDVVLLDWMMPRMTGLEVCQQLRATPSIARTPVILLTAKAQEIDIRRGLAAGADDYIVKPFSPRDLMTRVHSVLARAWRQT